MFVLILMQSPCVNKKVMMSLHYYVKLIVYSVQHICHAYMIVWLLISNNKKVGVGWTVLLILSSSVVQYVTKTCSFNLLFPQ